MRLDTAWQMVSTQPGQYTTPKDLVAVESAWQPAIVPGTVAQSLVAAGSWSLGEPDDYDARDWWYACSFGVPTTELGSAHLLCMEGLATLADVWLNDELILRANNMHLGYEVAIGDKLKHQNRLMIRFHSLTKAMSERRPRPRWKPQLLANQQLRWFRTSLLGRIRGYCPAVAPIGPWRPVSIIRELPGRISNIKMLATVENGVGTLRFSCRLSGLSGMPVEAALEMAGISSGLTVKADADNLVLVGEVRVPEVQRWWPHTHGKQHRYPVVLAVRSAENVIRHDLGKVGFRNVHLNQKDGEFSFSINGEQIFCRGACWTTMDLVSLQATEVQYRNVLQKVKDAGGNMVRVSGTMHYEQDIFYELCDELGILVWQDFMFDAMDYPASDIEFSSLVASEVRHQLSRFRQHACICIYCGNSDVEMLASMFGVPRDLWRNTLFAELIPALCMQEHPGIPYMHSVPQGGEWPFHVGRGASTYWGVGPFRGPLSGVRRDNLRFVSEGLGFANVPDQEMIERIFSPDIPMAHDARWKRRTPKDVGLGYDFDDVRDHYVQELYGVDPWRLRMMDTRRYLDLGRLATGEAMLQTFSEWRSSFSRCRGALIWYLKDVWPGAGFGLLDSDARPKACYYYVRRGWQSQTVLLTNEGLNGFHLHVINEARSPLQGVVELVLLRSGDVVTASGKMQIHLNCGENRTISADTMLNGFYDTAYAYRFGAPAHDVVVATLLDPNGDIISQMFGFPHVKQPEKAPANALLTEFIVRDDKLFLRLTTKAFLYGVRISLQGYAPEDNYFHLSPGYPREIRLQPVTDVTGKVGGHVEAINLTSNIPIHT